MTAPNPERLRELLAKIEAGCLPPQWENAAREIITALPALLHQLAERDAEVERLNAECKQHLLRALENGAAYHAAERARDEATGLLRDCDTVANVRGMLGVPDCIDNNGQPYQSAHLAAFLAASGGGKP